MNLADSGRASRWTVRVLACTTILQAVLLVVVVWLWLRSNPFLEQGDPLPQTGPVLVEYEGGVIRESQLNRLIEMRIEEMLARQGATGDGQLRQVIEKQLELPDMRQSLLEELVRTTIFAREARRLGLHRVPEYRQALWAGSNRLLAERLQLRAWEEIPVREQDLEAYFNARRDTYREPATLEVAVIRMQDETDAKQAVKSIQSPDDFRKLLAKRKESDGNSAVGHFLLTDSEAHAYLGDTADLFALKKGEWTRQPFRAVNGDALLVLVERKAEARVPEFQELIARVKREYLYDKRTDANQQLDKKLRKRYKVRINGARD